MSERQKEISLAMLALWGYMGEGEEKQPSSKQMSAVLPMGEEVRKYKGKTIKKRADGRYWARYYKDGKQCSVYGSTIDECLKNLKEALDGKTKQKKEPTKQLTLKDWLDKWLTLYKVGKVKNSTLEQMKRYLNGLPTEFSKKTLKKLTALDLQDYLNSIDKPRKKEKLFTFLRDAITKATKLKLLADNPFDAVDKPKHDKKLSRALTHEEEAQFVEACHSTKQGDLFLLCLYEGLRLGEALALTYDDIDFDKRTITINKSIDSLGQLTTPKTATSNRVIPLFKKAEPLLNKQGQGPIFRYARKAYQNRMRNICIELNLPDCSIHTLRHTFATRCSEAGIAAKTVQKWLGHSTLEMTLNVYTHINADFEQKETAKFDTYFDTQNC